MQARLNRKQKVEAQRIIVGDLLKKIKHQLIS